MEALVSQGYFPPLNTIELKWILMSYYSISTKTDTDVFFKIRDYSDEILIDSGAFSFQRNGKKTDWDKQTENYAKFIQRFDRPNVIGYFEMDIDNIVGYEKVLEMRRYLEQFTDKIIPVWHMSRGVNEFKKMCQDYSGKIVAVTGFKNEEIKDEQLVMFLKYAHSCGCKLHILGLTRRSVLDKVPIDYCDSSSWQQQMLHGQIITNGSVEKFSKTQSKNLKATLARCYNESVKLQKYYYGKWQKICKD